MDLGPVQLLVIGFDHPGRQGGVLAELDRLTDLGLVCVLDVLVLDRDDEGTITVAELTGLPLDEMAWLGTLAGTLVGLGAAAAADRFETAAAHRAAGTAGHLLDGLDLVDVLSEIPNGSAAAVALIEHRWAASLRDRIVGAGGTPRVDMWVHPLDLVAAPAIAAAG